MISLDDLAERSGIAASYVDARGQTRLTAPGTKQALLAAMAAGDERGGDSAFSPLPPVCVVVQGASGAGPALTMKQDTLAIAWRIELEDGGALGGEAAFPDLELLPAGDRRQEGIVCRRLVLPAGLPLGYHRLRVAQAAGETVLIVSPGKCWIPDAVAGGRRIWGVAAQLYLLRSERNWGIGDYGDLARLVRMFGERGADVIGLNPLHALFLDKPEQASPYSPASRLLLNVLNIDVESMPELQGCGPARALIESAAFQDALADCRAAHLLDYQGVADLKLRVLRLMFGDCRAALTLHWVDFERFRRERGEELERACLFGALRDHFTASNPDLTDWRRWPEEYRTPDSPAVARFAVCHEDAVTFRVWLQYVADRQLAAAASAARGMVVGLYRDLAVGADREGAETWANQSAVVSGARIGAPPDIYNPAGQDWGLPPFHPGALRQEAYRSFVSLLRANMRHAGGLRIDHVMALQQLYWVPEGRSAAEGAYVRYDLDELIGILALESHRHHCLVVGEDLGTVPEGFRERMAAANILSYRVLFFEQDEQGFSAPAHYPALAMAVAGSHDLPTLRGWWRATDIGLKQKLGLYPDADGASDALRQRDKDRLAFVQALRRENLLPDATPGVDAFADAAHRYLARTRAALAMVQMDDVTAEADPVNVPATSDEHPNWRRRLSMTLEDIEGLGLADRIAALVAEERDSPGAA